MNQKIDFPQTKSTYTSNISIMASIESKSVAELVAACKERGIRGYSGKKKHELIQLLTQAGAPPPSPIADAKVEVEVEPTNVIECATVEASAHTKNALSLFSGAGGDTCGLEAAGWKVAHFSEFNAPATQTHKAAFPSSELLATSDGSNDIKKIPDETFVKLRGGVA
jgi:hypothetical protein